MDFLVSIVIPAFNPGNLILETINSVLNQTYQNFEIIIVDDGSTDNTKEIIKSYNDKRIKYFFQDNCGIPAKVRNRGAALSSGEYIAFLDHDDIWMDNKLAKQIEIVSNDAEIAMVSTNGYYLFDNEKSSEIMISGFKSSYFSERNLFPGNSVFQSSVIINKKAFETLGGFNESTELKAIEDYDLWLRLFKKFKCYFISEPLAYYRIHGNATSGGEIKSLERDIVHLEKYFDTYGFEKHYKNDRKYYTILRLGILRLEKGDEDWRNEFRKLVKIKRKLFSAGLFFISYLPRSFALLLYSIYK